MKLVVCWEVALVEGLPDGSGKPAEGFCAGALWRICNGQPEPKLKNGC